MEGFLANVGIGLVSGAFLAGAGWIKSRDAGGYTEPFDTVKFARTTLLGAIVGGISGATGVAPEVIISWPLYTGITALVENLLKGIFRSIR